MTMFRNWMILGIIHNFLKQLIAHSYGILFIWSNHNSHGIPDPPLLLLEPDFQSVTSPQGAGWPGKAHRKLAFNSFIITGDNKNTNVQFEPL